jgi:chromosome segregation ATPase
MTLALEIAFAASIVVVGATLLGVVFWRVPERLLVASAAALALLALAGAVVAGIRIAEGTSDEALLLVTVGGLLVAALAQAALVVLARGLRRVENLERVGDQARDRLDSYLEEHADRRSAELERVLAKERANASYVLGEQERRLAEERRDMVARQAELARVELAEAVTSAQERLESRLRAWAADLDRGQGEMEAQLAELGQRQKDALTEYDARLRADAERLATASEEQRQAIAQLRSEFERVLTDFVEEGRGEIETHADERRRALHEVGERLRARERALREQIEREEVEARARLVQELTEVERRQLAQLERTLERAASRLSEDADRRFDEQIKASREKSAQRLSHELDKSLEEFVRQAENEVSDRITELGRLTADRMERRLRDVARAAEAQGEVASERVRNLTERFDKSLAAAEERIAAFEAYAEIRLDAVERSGKRS